MTVNISKPAVNVREKLAELDKPTGIAGEAMLRAETPQEQFNLIGAGRRNLIINGDMRIASRGTSFTSEGFTLDRFKFDVYETDQLAVEITQSSDAPNGFANSLKIDTTTAETTLDSDEYVRLMYQIEGQDLQQLAYGTSAAQSLSISFWVKSSVTGTYATTIYQFDGNDNIGSTYTINAANTWEYKTITFAGNTAAVIANDNTAGLLINFFLMVGSDYTSTDNTSWGSYSGGRFAYGHAVKVGTSTSDDFYITGVQLELGKVATPFEHRSYGEELALCQRYFQIYGGASTEHFAGGVMQTNRLNLIKHFPVTMRAAPSFSATAYGGGWSDWKVYWGTNNANATGTDENYPSVNSISFSVLHGSSSTAGNAGYIYANNANARLSFDAEL